MRWGLKVGIDKFNFFAQQFRICEGRFWIYLMIYLLTYLLAYILWHEDENEVDKDLLPLLVIVSSKTGKSKS